MECIDTNVFNSLESDEDRVQYIFSCTRNASPPRISFKEKDKAMALCLREMGDIACHEGRDEEALKFYTQSIILQPVDTEEGKSNLAVLMEKRSALQSQLREDASRNEVKATVQPHPFLPNASKKLKLTSSADAGRYILASADIMPGETLLTEKAFASVLSYDKYETHCPSCFQRMSAPIPCSRCAGVAFCSLTCRDAATWHRYECPITETLARLQHFELQRCYLPLRMFTQTSWIELRSLLPHLTTDDRNGGTCRVYDSSSYTSIYSLVTHSGRRTQEEVLDLTILAVFLIKHLQLVGYFLDTTRVSAGSVTEDEVSATCLMIHNLKLTQFNVHAISEFTRNSKKPERIGVGIFPTLALFNHSCDLRTLRYYVGNHVILKSLCGFSPGNEVTDNYGPAFRMDSKAKRLASLHSSHWFECRCQACCEDWPLYDAMCEDETPHFKCSTANCHTVLSGLPNEQNLLLCKHCHSETDIGKAYEKLKLNDAKFFTSTEMFKSGCIQESRVAFAKILMEWDRLISVPYKKYFTCQQLLMKCLVY